MKDETKMEEKVEIEKNEIKVEVRKEETKKEKIERKRVRIEKKKIFTTEICIKLSSQLSNVNLICLIHV